MFRKACSIAAFFVGLSVFACPNYGQSAILSSARQAAADRSIRPKIIGPLTDPTAHGSRAEDAFDVVIPSLPGFGFSSRPTATGWGPDRIAQAWAELMTRLGYTRYVAQGITRI